MLSVERLIAKNLMGLFKVNTGSDKNDVDKNKVIIDRFFVDNNRFFGDDKIFPRRNMGGDVVSVCCHGVGNVDDPEGRRNMIDFAGRQLRRSAKTAPGIFFEKIFMIELGVKK